MSERRRRCWVCGAPLLACAVALGQPVTVVLPVDGSDDTAAVAAAAVAGWTATADTYEDRVELRDMRGGLVRAFDRSALAALAPWMVLGGGPDGPNALAYTDSGRALYILVHDDTVAGDGQGSDVILRYDAAADALSVFARLEAFDRDDEFSHAGLGFFGGRLYVSTQTGMAMYSAGSSQGTGGLQWSGSLPDGGRARGFAFDRDTRRGWVCTDRSIYRFIAGANPPSFTLVGTLGSGAAGNELRALAWADHYGHPSGSQHGLYLLFGEPPSPVAGVYFVPAAQAGGTAAFAPALYLPATAVWHDLAFAADGSLLIGADEDAVRVSDGQDARLGLEAWIADEFSQHVRFVRGLISPDGEPPGWVIDADVTPGATRFHPASPDAAAWTVLMLMAADRINGDPGARGELTTVLERYGGVLSGPRPARSPDGIFEHWIDPATGNQEWADGFATLSTMKIVAAAARAMRAYPDDERIARAGSRIIFGVRNWPAYIQGGTDALWFLGSSGGGPLTSGARGFAFNEGMIFVEQAAHFAPGTTAGAAHARWMNRGLWPTATYLSGRLVTGSAAGQFQSAFLTMYQVIVNAGFRASAGWREQVQNLRWSHAAWTDDAGPRYSTVFSAGTTKSQWGGYNADSLSNHPGDVTTFPSLLALGAMASGINPLAEVVGGYQAYRRGARQTFKGGASLLYRRSEVDRAYTPNSAGIPDVTIGGLGLAEVLSPGFVDSTLATGYPERELCPRDLNGDGSVDAEDLYRLYRVPQDLNGDGVIDTRDVRCLEAWLRRREGPDVGER